MTPASVQQHQPRFVSTPEAQGSHDPDPSSDFLGRLLAASREEIHQYGISKEDMTPWVDQFCQDLASDKVPYVYSMENAWMLDRSAPVLEFVTNHRLSNDYNFSNLGSSIRKCLHPMTTQTFWTRSTSKEFMNMVFILNQFYQTFDLDDSSKQLFEHWMDCLVARANSISPGLQNVDCFTVTHARSDQLTDWPLRREIMKHKQTVFLKTEKGWRLGMGDDFPTLPIRGGDLPRLPINIAHFKENGKQVLVVDQSGKAVERPCVLIRSKMFPKDDVLKHNFESRIKVEMILYRGSHELLQGQDNAVTFVFDINLDVQPCRMEYFRLEGFLTASTNGVSPQQFEAVKEQAEVLFKTFPQLSGVQSMEPLIFELTPPNSAFDKCTVLSNLLKELERDPDANADLIYEAIGLIGCDDFSEEEVASLVKNGQAKEAQEGYEISPKAVVAKLKKSLGKKMVQSTPALAAPAVAQKSELQKPSAPTLETKTAPIFAATREELAENGRRMEQHRLEKEVLKARRREELAYEQKKQTAREQADQQEGTFAQDASLLGFSEKDQAKVENIYQGKPMNAKNFATFAMGLLRKKVAAIGGAVSERVKGSHPKLHFKRKDGPSGGVTFRIHHGGDKHGSLPAQKDTLARILAI
jgi:hypothetical protein